MPVEQKDGSKMNKLLFFLYAPNSADTKDKFVYVSGKSAFKSKIGSVQKEFRVFFIYIHLLITLTLTHTHYS